MNDVAAAPLEPALVAETPLAGTDATATAGTTTTTTTESATVAAYDPKAAPHPGCRHEVCENERLGLGACPPGICRRKKEGPVADHPRPPCPIHDVMPATPPK